MTLREAFDARFEKLLICYRSPKSPFLHELGLRTESESALSLGMPGVVILLGKNGSGKTRFLNGLDAFGKKQKNLSPEIILRYSIPSLEEHLSYLESREILQRNEDQVNESNILQRFEALDLPFHDVIIRTVASSILNFSFRESFGFDTGEEILRYFGLPTTEVESFNQRMLKHEIEFGSYHPAQSDSIDEVRENLNFRDYFPEFFLSLLSNSFVHRKPWQIGPGSAFNSDSFINDPDERKRLVAGLRDLYEGTTHVDLMCLNGNVYLSLVNKDNWGNPLADLLSVIENLKKEYDADSFPMDLFRDEQLPSTLFLKVRPEFINGIWKPFDVLNLTFQSRSDSINGLSKLFRNFLKLDVQHITGPNYEIKVSGLERLDRLLKQVSNFLSEIEIGISKIELQNPEIAPIGTNYTEFEFDSIGGLSSSKRTHDFTPVVIWHGKGSQQPLLLDSCSDGQLDVLRILVHLCAFINAAQPENTKFMVIDEFDRHLHQVVSQQLLDLLHRYAKKSGTYVLASTHSIGSLAIHKYTQIFASQDFSGIHHLSTNRHQDPKIVAHYLGVPELEVRKLVKLFVLVEGEHEEIIFKKFFSSEASGLFDVELIVLNGLYGLASFWRSYLQYEIADVLLVYDKQNSALEEVWSSIQRNREKAQIVEDLWDRSEIRQLHRKRNERQRTRTAIAGDTELNSLAFLLKEILSPNENQIRNIQRFHLHGVEVPDIVDCLPISAFPKAKSFGSWEKLREQNHHLEPTEFKRLFEINNSTVERAVGLSSDSVHPELQRLWARIVGILDIPDDWPMI